MTAYKAASFVPQWVKREDEWKDMSGSEKAEWYVSNILNDSLPIAKRIKQAAHRFRTWQEKYDYDPVAVDKAVTRIEHFEAPEGEFDRMQVYPWQAMVVAILHGFTVYSEEYQGPVRACNELLLVVPRKSGKSTLTAALCLLEVTQPFGGARSPNIVTAGVNEDTSRITFDKAIAMLSHDKHKNEGKHRGFVHKYKMKFGVKEIKCGTTNGTIKVLTLGAKSKEGRTLVGYVVDEVATIPDRSWLTPLRTGFGAARSRLCFLTSTPADEFINALDDELDDAVRLLDGEDDDTTRRFPMIFRAEKEEMEDAHDPRLWERVQPSLGKACSTMYYEEQYQEAKGGEDTMHGFYTRQLCAPSKPIDVWITPEQVEATEDPGEPDPSWCRRWTIGVDLSDTNDYTAICLLGYNDSEHKAKVWFEAHCPHTAIPEEDVSSRHAARVREWHREGKLMVHQGDYMDHKIIAHRLHVLADKFKPLGIFFDSYTAISEVAKYSEPEVVALFDRRSLTAVKSAEPLNILVSWVQNGEVAMEKSPVFVQHLKNAVLVQRPDGGRVLQKSTPNSKAKIDLVDALMSAVNGYFISRDDNIAGTDRAPITMPDDTPGSDDDDDTPPIVLT